MWLMFFEDLQAIAQMFFGLGLEGLVLGYRLFCLFFKGAPLPSSCEQLADVAFYGGITSSFMSTPTYLQLTLDCLIKSSDILA